MANWWTEDWKKWTEGATATIQSDRGQLRPGLMSNVPALVRHAPPIYLGDDGRFHFGHLQSRRIYPGVQYSMWFASQDGWPTDLAVWPTGYDPETARRIHTEYHRRRRHD